MVFPLFNEAVILKEQIRQVLAFIKTLPLPMEIILVDDGSRDHTLSTAYKLAEENPVIRVVSLPQNLGKGGALQAGVAQSRGNYVLFSDIDLSVSLNELPPFLEVLRNGKDLALGSRRVSGAKVLVHQSFYRECLGRGFTALSRFLLGMKVSDFTCGFKAFRGEVARDLFASLTLKDWSFDAEILFLAKKRGYNHQELPVNWMNRRDSRVRLRKDILTSFLGLLRIPWRHRHG